MLLLIFGYSYMNTTGIVELEATGAGSKRTLTAILPSLQLMRDTLGTTCILFDTRRTLPLLGLGQLTRWPTRVVLKSIYTV